MSTPLRMPETYTKMVELFPRLDIPEPKNSIFLRLDLKTITLKIDDNVVIEDDFYPSDSKDYEVFKKALDLFKPSARDASLRHFEVHALNGHFTSAVTSEVLTA